MRKKPRATRVHRPYIAPVARFRGGFIDPGAGHIFTAGSLANNNFDWEKVHIQIRKITLALAAASALSALSAQAANLVVNGGFEATTNGKGQLGFNTNATGWTNVNGYTFLYAPGSVDSSGAIGEFGNVSM